MLSRASITTREARALSNHRSTVLEGIAAGILFALLMQLRPVRLAVYALCAWGLFLWVQDWRSEHRLPDDTAALDWAIERAEQQPVFSERALTYTAAFRVQNRGTELLQSATLVGTLYECPSLDDPLAACTPVDRSRNHVALDLPPGFVHHMTVYASFSHAGGPNPRAIWTLTDIIADRDAEG
jgi:hypothetical protein